MSSPLEPPFTVQAGFVEGIAAEWRRFGTLANALAHALRRNREFAIVQWNRLPVALSYPEDIAPLAGGLVTLLATLETAGEAEMGALPIHTRNVDATWDIEVVEDRLRVHARWQRVAGDYEDALNALPTLSIGRVAFLCEWKLVLEQLAQVLSNCECVLTTRPAQEAAAQLKALSECIPRRGLLYDSA